MSLNAARVVAARSLTSHKDGESVRFYGVKSSPVREIEKDLPTGGLGTPSG